MHFFMLTMPLLPQKGLSLKAIITFYIMENKYIISIGEVLWDMLPGGKQLGGAPANFAYHTTHLGLPTLLVSAVGNDTEGAEAEQALQQKGINASLLHRNEPTGRVMVELDAEGIPTYNICEHVAWDHIELSLDVKELASNCAVLCFGTLAQRSETTRTAIYTLAQRVRQNPESLIVCDINLRAPHFTKEIVEHSLHTCHSLKLNIEELQTISHMFGIKKTLAQEQAEDLRGRFHLRHVILTCGTEGSYIFHEDGISFRPTPRILVADTVGAGDAFTAAFCASMVQGESITTAHQRAVELSALVCTRSGAMPSI